MILISRYFVYFVVRLLLKYDEKQAQSAIQDNNDIHYILWVYIIFFGLPFPRGKRICSDYSTYYENWRGIYYISVEHVLNLINFGHWGYLKDVSKETFIILDDNWARIKTCMVSRQNYRNCRCCIFQRG